MDGVSIAGSIIGIAGAGVQVSIKLVTLATQISTAPERVSSIGNDVSLTAGILHQLGELMTQKSTDDGIKIFSEQGLETTRTSANVCGRIFAEIETEVRKASDQVRSSKRLDGGRVRLSKSEMAKWPFRQPRMEILRNDLREAKQTLMLMLQITSLALSKRMADSNKWTSSVEAIEQRDLSTAIVALYQQQQQQQTSPNVNLPARTRSSQDTMDMSPEDFSMESTRDTASRFSGKTTPNTLDGSQAGISQTELRLHARHANASNAMQDPPIQITEPFVEPKGDSRRHVDLKNDTIVSFKTIPTRDQIMNSSSNSNGSQSRPGQPNTKGYVSEGQDEKQSENSPDGLIKKELHLFLLQPIVKDFFDKIELSWPVQNIKMQPQAIQKHIAKNEQDGLPSVVDMLENLHAYEQAMIDDEVAKGSEGTLLSIKRTKTDIKHRDITMKDVPGLQFVVERKPVHSHLELVTNDSFSDFQRLKSRAPDESGGIPNHGIGLSEAAVAPTTTYGRRRTDNQSFGDLHSRSRTRRYYSEVDAKPDYAENPQEVLSLGLSNLYVASLGMMYGVLVPGVAIPIGAPGMGSAAVAGLYEISSASDADVDLPAYSKHLRSTPRASTSFSPSPYSGRNMSNIDYRQDPSHQVTRDTKEHVAEHPASFQCMLCPKTFTQASYLHSHICYHTGECPFECPTCGVAFARFEDCQSHQSLHTEPLQVRYHHREQQDRDFAASLPLINPYEPRGVSSAEGRMNTRKRTKTGCLTCRKRRIRCGEERPACQNCVRSKRECEGYVPRIVFKDPIGALRPEKQSLSTRTSQTQDFHSDTSIHGGSSFVSADTPSAPRLQPDEDSIDLSSNPAVFAGLNHLITVENGMVADNEGNLVGIVVEGEENGAARSGNRVLENGQIVDEDDIVIGRADQLAEAEGIEEGGEWQGKELEKKPEEETKQRSKERPMVKQDEEVGPSVGEDMRALQGRSTSFRYEEEWAASQILPTTSQYSQTEVKRPEAQFAKSSDKDSDIDNTSQNLAVPENSASLSRSPDSRQSGYRGRSGSHHDNEGPSFNDSGLSHSFGAKPDDHHFPTEPNRKDYPFSTPNQIDHLPFGSLTPPYTASQRSYSIVSSSTGITPTVTASPPFPPIQPQSSPYQNHQSLPSFSTILSRSSISSITGDSPLSYKRPVQAYKYDFQVSHETARQLFDIPSTNKPPSPASGMEGITYNDPSDTADEDLYAATDEEDEHGEGVDGDGENEAEEVEQEEDVDLVDRLLEKYTTLFNS